MFALCCSCRGDVQAYSGAACSTEISFRVCWRCVVGVVVVFGPSLGAAVSHVFPATHTRPSEGCDVGRRADGARRGCVTRLDMGTSVVAIIGFLTVQYNVYHDALVRRLSQGLESR